MKKILVVIFIICTFSSLKIFANEVIITVPNELNDNYICDDELIHYSNIHWDQEGDYKIEYFEKGNMEFNTKDVIIRNIDNLKKGIDLKTTEKIDVGENILVEKIIYLTANEFFILGSIDLNKYPYETNVIKRFAYIAYYKNNCLVWQNIINQNRYGSLIDGVIMEKGIAVIGEYDSINEASNVFIKIISFNNNIIYEKEVHGSLNEYAKSIKYYNNMLVFTGISESKDKDFFAFTKTGYDIMIGKINLDTYELEIHLFGNSGNNLLIDTIEYNGYLYLYVYLKGGGYYDNFGGKENDFKCIVEVDNRFGISNWLPLESLNRETNDRLIIYNNQLVIYNFQYNSANITFEVYDLKFNFINFYTHKIKGVDKIHNVLINVDRNRLIVFSNSKNSSSYIRTIQMLDENFKELRLYSWEEDEITEYLINLITFQNEVIITLFDYLKGEVKKYNYLNILLKENILNNKRYKVYDFDVFLNNELQNKEIFQSSNKFNPFGQYVELYIVKKGELEIIIPIDKYYYLDTNIKNNEVYDINYLLRFNGKGYLNDELINTNYILKNCGKYVLEVVGNNGEKKIIHFEVGDLSYESNTLDDKLDINTSIVNDSNLINEEVNINLNKIDEDNIDYLSVVIVFFLACLGISFGLFTRQKFWRKRND